MDFVVKTPQIGDSDSVRFSDGEYIEGMTLTQHLNQMKLSAFVAIAAVIGGSFLVPNPAEAAQKVKWINSLNTSSADGPALYIGKCSNWLITEACPEGKPFKVN